MSESSGHSKRPINIFIFGNSHVRTLKSALSNKIYSKNTEEIYFDADYIAPADSNGIQEGRSFSESIKDAERLSEQDILVVSTAGTEHNIIGLLQSDKPFNFDFTDKETIPYRVILDHMMEAARRNRAVLAYRNATKARFYHLPPPPPKGDNEYIYKNMVQYRGIPLAKAIINPPPVRLRLWEIEMDALRRVCAEWGAEFLPVPAESRTNDGFLKPEYYGPDGTHTNAAYGALVLEQLATLATTDSKESENAHD